MSKKYCVTCGAAHMTAHATNCPAYLENKDKRIAELEARLKRLADAMLVAKGKVLRNKDQRIAELGAEVTHWIAESQAQTDELAEVKEELSDVVMENEALEAENKRQQDALQEIAESSHLGNRWAQRKAEATLEISSDE